MEISWSQFKSIATSKLLLIQYIDLDTRYWLVAYDGPFRIECILDKEDITAKTEFESSFKASANKSLSQTQQLPFASKQIGSKKLYKRVHGIQQALSVPENEQFGENEILFPIPYPWVKITGVEIVGCEALETVHFLVLDSGMVTGVKDTVLNQFAFGMNLPNGFYEHKSEYDADLYQNMTLKVIYRAKSNKTVGINVIMNEVK